MKVGVLASTFFACLIGFPIVSWAGLAPDADSDGIPDVLDKCSQDSRNSIAGQGCDTDSDGYGNICDADFNQDFIVNSNDFGTYFIPAFKGFTAPTHGEDMNCDGLVNSNDFGTYFVPKFKGLAPGGATPGPSGLSCAGVPGCS